MSAELKLVMQYSYIIVDMLHKNQFNHQEVIVLGILIIGVS